MRTIQDKIEWLQRSVYRLDGTADRPIARRNARRKVLSALRAIRAQVDREYPALAVAKRQQRKGVNAARNEGQMRRMMRNRGFLAVAVGDAGLYAAAGVRVRKVWDYLFVPSWAVAIGIDEPVQLRAALKSVKLRRAALAAAALARG